MAKPKSDFCPQGHPYKGKNLIIHKRGYWVCRKCNNKRCRKYYQNDRPNRLKKMKEYRKKNKEIMKLSDKRCKRNIKLDLYKILGGSRCQCKSKNCLHNERCKIDDERVSQVDHINGGGYQELKRFNTHYTMWNWYRKHPKLAKKRLQILCANCNWVKRMNRREYLYKLRSKS